MRIYSNFKEALNEIKRDLAEMGIKVTTQTMQDKSRPEGFETLELQNYIYTVINPNVKFLSPTQPWADLEFEERISEKAINPGKAYLKRLDIWGEFLEQTLYPDGSYGPSFSYTYPERMWFQLKRIVDELKKHPDSRQLFLSVWDPCKDIYRLGVRRVPCTLGYYFQNRQGYVHMTYLQRSADFVTHFQNDIYLAIRLLKWVCNKANCKPGRFTHWIGSLHIYKEDVKDVF
jgi:thymidylate synthase